MKFSFIAKHRGGWPAGWLCEALGVSRGGFYAWLTRSRSELDPRDEELAAKVRASFLASDRTYGARRVWHDLLADGVSCGLHRIERLMRLQALKARPRRRRLPADPGERNIAAVAPNVLDRGFEAHAPNRKWIADFTPAFAGAGSCLDGRGLAICNRTHRPLLRRAFDRPCVLCARSSATRRSFPSLHCPTHCLTCSSSRGRRGPSSAAGTVHWCIGCRDRNDAAARPVCLAARSP